MVKILILFDSGSIYSYINSDNEKHNIALPIMREALRGQYGKLMVSNYVLDEALTLARARTRRCDCGRAILVFVRTKEEDKAAFYEIIVDRTMIEVAEGYYEKFCEKGLSFTDCIQLAIIEKHEIQYFATFDRSFIGLAEILPTA